MTDAGGVCPQETVGKTAIDRRQEIINILGKFNFILIAKKKIQIVYHQNLVSI